MTYAYADQTAVVGPLAVASEPHSWDLCEAHAAKITAPLGWELMRVHDIYPDADEDDDLTALAEAVREAGRHSSGLVVDDQPATVPRVRTARTIRCVVLRKFARIVRSAAVIFSLCRISTKQMMIPKIRIFAL